MRMEAGLRLSHRILARKRIVVPSQHKRRRSSSSSSSSPSPSPSPSPSSSPCRAEEEKEDERMLGKTICFCGYNDEKNIEWYYFDVSGEKKKKKIKCFHQLLFDDRDDDDNMDYYNHGDEDGDLDDDMDYHDEDGDDHEDEDDDDRQQPPPPILFSVNDEALPVSEKYAAVGSIFYRFGDHQTIRKCVFCIDLRFPEYGWKECAPMINKRIAHRSTVLNGKIYVMGGGDFWKPGLWAEVYDPVLDKWSPLPTPPPLPSKGSFSRPKFIAAIHASNKILVSLKESDDLYMYDATFNDWERVEYNIRPSLNGRASVVGQTIYWCIGASVHAFDLERKFRFAGSIDCLKDYIWMHSDADCRFQPTLLHLGGDDFCLFWVDHPVLDIYPTRSHCLKIQVSKRDHVNVNPRGIPGVLDVSVKSCQSYNIDSAITSIDALVLDGRFRVENNLQD